MKRFLQIDTHESSNFMAITYPRAKYGHGFKLTGLFIAGLLENCQGKSFRIGRLGLVRLLKGCEIMSQVFPRVQRTDRSATNSEEGTRLLFTLGHVFAGIRPKFVKLPSIVRLTLGCHFLHCETEGCRGSENGTHSGGRSWKAP